MYTCELVSNSVSAISLSLLMSAGLVEATFQASCSKKVFAFLSLDIFKLMFKPFETFSHLVFLKSAAKIAPFKINI